VHRDGFDGPNPVWARGAASVGFQEERHALSEKYKYAWVSSEYIRVNADAPGPQLSPFIYYVYPIPRAPVTNDCSGNVKVRSGRPGVQLLARAVLPKEQASASSKEPLTVLLPAEVYDGGGDRWQRLELRQPLKLLKLEQQKLRTQLGRDV